MPLDNINFVAGYINNKYFYLFINTVTLSAILGWCQFVMTCNFFSHLSIHCTGRLTPMGAIFLVIVILIGQGKFLFSVITQVNFSEMHEAKSLSNESSFVVNKFFSVIILDHFWVWLASVCLFLCLWVCCHHNYHNHNNYFCASVHCLLGLQVRTFSINFMRGLVGWQT